MGTYAPVRPTKYCHACARVVDAQAVICPGCGVAQPSPESRSDKRILPAAVLCLLFGVFGAHRFYVGKVGTGFLQLITIGGLGIWWLIDLVMIIAGAFRDSDDQRITHWV